jgi:hypothetical protein
MSTFLQTCIRTCRESTTMILSSTLVMCAAPATLPAMIRDCLIFFRARPAKGAPFAVGADISTMHLLSAVKEPEAVAREAEDGRMI